MLVGESSCSYSEIELWIFSLFIHEMIGFIILLLKKYIHFEYINLKLYQKIYTHEVIYTFENTKH